MKKYTLLFFVLITVSSFGQTLNNFKYLIVPVKFDFQSDINQYRLNSNAKFTLTKYGFTTLFSNDTLPLDLAKNKCKAMYFDVIKVKGFLTTKVYVVIKDCQNKILYQGPEGKTKEKLLEKAYNEALTEALLPLQRLNYKYNEVAETNESVVVAETPTVSSSTPQENISGQEIAKDVLFAQPIPNGFQLINSEPKIVFKLFKTSVQDVYLAAKDSLQGVVVKKGNVYYFESYQDNRLVSEKMDIKF